MKPKPLPSPTVACLELLRWIDEIFDEDEDLPLVFFDAAATVGYAHDRRYVDRLDIDQDDEEV